MLDGMLNHKPDLRFALKPNCLLTRRPLIWLTPPRSVFFYKQPWSDIIDLLFEHGYKVSLLQLPFQNIEIKKKVILRNTERLNNSHVFVDSVTYELCRNELLNLINSTITVIGKSATACYTFLPQNKKNNINYFFHYLWCKFLNVSTPKTEDTFIECEESSWHKLLNHCVDLAELDFELNSKHN